MRNVVFLKNVNVIHAHRGGVMRMAMLRNIYHMPTFVTKQAQPDMWMVLSPAYEEEKHVHVSFFFFSPLS